MAVVKKKNRKKASIGEDVEKFKHLCTAGGNVKWGRYYGKQYDISSKEKSNIELSYDPAIPLLGI